MTPRTARRLRILGSASRLREWWDLQHLVSTLRARCEHPGGCPLSSYSLDVAERRLSALGCHGPIPGAALRRALRIATSMDRIEEWGSLGDTIKYTSAILANTAGTSRQARELNALRVDAKMRLAALGRDPS